MNHQRPTNDSPPILCAPSSKFPVAAPSHYALVQVEEGMRQPVGNAGNNHHYYYQSYRQDAAPEENSQQVLPISICSVIARLYVVKRLVNTGPSRMRYALSGFANGERASALYQTLQRTPLTPAFRCCHRTLEAYNWKSIQCRDSFLVYRSTTRHQCHPRLRTKAPHEQQEEVEKEMLEDMENWDQ